MAAARDRTMVVIKVYPAWGALGETNWVFIGEAVIRRDVPLRAPIDSTYRDNWNRYRPSSADIGTGKIAAAHSPGNCALNRRLDRWSGWQRWCHYTLWPKTTWS